MNAIAVIALGCITFASHVQAQSTGTSGSTMEQFVLRSDGTMVPVAEPKAAPRTVTPIAPPEGPRASASSNANQVIAAPPVSSAGSIADPESTPAAQAVAAARQALNSKQFAQLASFVPKARGDILAIYPEYWYVRTKVWYYNAVGAREEIERFLEKYKG